MRGRRSSSTANSFFVLVKLRFELDEEDVAAFVAGSRLRPAATPTPVPASSSAGLRAADGAPPDAGTPPRPRTAQLVEGYRPAFSGVAQRVPWWDAGRPGRAAGLEEGDAHFWHGA